MKQDKIVLIEHELIIREDITLYDLSRRFPGVFIQSTRVNYTLDDRFILNGVSHIIPKSLIPASGNEKECWAFAALTGYFTFNFIPEPNRRLTNVFYRRYNPDIRQDNRGAFIKIDEPDRLFYDDAPELGIEFCQFKKGLREEITNFYSIQNPQGVLLIPMV